MHKFPIALVICRRVDSSGDDKKQTRADKILLSPAISRNCSKKEHGEEPIIKNYSQSNSIQLNVIRVILNVTL